MTLSDWKSYEFQLAELLQEDDTDDEGCIAAKQLQDLLSDECVNSLLLALGVHYTTPADTIAAMEAGIVTNNVSKECFLKARISLTDCNGDILHAIYEVTRLEEIAQTRDNVQPGGQT